MGFVMRRLWTQMRAQASAGYAPQSDGKALAAPACALGVGVHEYETRREIVLDPVHRRTDQIEDRPAIDEQRAAGRIDALVERLRLGDIVDRVSEPRTAAPRR